MSSESPVKGSKITKKQKDLIMENLSKPENPSNLFRIYNKIEENFHLSNKKALFWNMKNYYKAIKQDPWDAIPVTFHIQDGPEDPEFINFIEYYKKREQLIRDMERQIQENMVQRKEEARLKKRQERMKLLASQKSGSDEDEEDGTESESDSESSGESQGGDGSDSEDERAKIPANIWIIKPGENSNRGNGIVVRK